MQIETLLKVVTDFHGTAVAFSWVKFWISFSANSSSGQRFPEDSLMKSFEMQKVSDVQEEHFVDILKSNAIEFKDEVDIHHTWNKLKYLLEMKDSEPGINHPALLSTACFHLDLLPRYPKYGSQDGHEWHKDEGAYEMNTGDRDANEVRLNLLNMIKEGTILLESGDPDTDSDEEENANEGFNERLEKTSLQRDARRKMSGLWGQPVREPDRKTPAATAATAGAVAVAAATIKSKKKKGINNNWGRRKAIAKGGCQRVVPDSASSQASKEQLEANDEGEGGENPEIDDQRPTGAITHRHELLPVP